MAIDEHLRILGQGIRLWDKWRREHREIRPDLGGADLRGTDLRGVDLGGAYLRGACLSGADLGTANLSGANLSRANLSSAYLRYACLGAADLNDADLNNADLRGANLCEANLSGAQCNSSNLSDVNLSVADLSGTSLRGADLSRSNLSVTILVSANLSKAKLSGTNMSKALADRTVFDDVDLSKVEGLERIHHLGPSGLSISTLYRSQGEIPEVFLRGCGLRDWEIEGTKLYGDKLSRNQIVELAYKVIELRSDPLIQFYSCFISYSSKDEAFARRIFSGLQERGVRCWFAPEHMKIGDRIRNRLDDSIRMHDKLLLVLSETSVASQWIEQEVETALEKEREQGCDVLFPVRLDDEVMNIGRGWPALIRKTRHIGDFRKWGDYDEYRTAFELLLGDLRVNA